MKTLITMTMSVDEDGNSFHIRDSTQTHGNNWNDVLRGMIMLRDELDRQIKSGGKCPFNPQNIKRHGELRFEE